MTHIYSLKNKYEELYETLMRNFIKSNLKTFQRFITGKSLFAFRKIMLTS